MEAMNSEELRLLICDEEKVHILSEELDKMRMKRDERWIHNLVDSHI
jgi:hypothetical protein